jgi:hypothetical protein
LGKVRDRIWEVESKLPDAVKVHTDKAIRAGAKVAKRLHPFREDSKRRGEKWYRDQRKKLHI